MPKKTMAEEVTETLEKETKYSVSKLREKSIQLFGVSQSTFDGAMHGCSETEYTINEAKAVINTWLYGKRGK